MKEKLENLVKYVFIFLPAIYIILLVFFSFPSELIYYASYLFACITAFLQADRNVWYKRYMSLVNSIEESDTHTYEYTNYTTVELQESNESESDESVNSNGDTITNLRV